MIRVLHIAALLSVAAPGAPTARASLLVVASPRAPAGRATMPVPARDDAATTRVVDVAPPDTTLDPAVAREIEAARQRGLPAEALLAKVREGRLKRAPASRIRTAVSALATRLDSARAALGDDASNAELVAGADALAAGAEPGAVRAVGQAARVRPVSAPLGALAQLVASGVPSTRAAALIVDLMRRNATPAQMVAFGNAVESDAAGGLPGDEAARFRWREFGSGAAGSTNAAADFSTPSSNQGSTPPSRPPSTPRRRP